MIDFFKSDKFILPIVYIILGIMVRFIIKIITNKISKNKYINKKKETIISLIKNIIRYVIYIFVVLAILSVYGVDTSGIIASLGIAGLVIGLALQDIIADFVAGIFILYHRNLILEKQICKKCNKCTFHILTNIFLYVIINLQGWW